MTKERYEKDLSALIKKGLALYNAIQYECVPQAFTQAATEKYGDDIEQFLQKIPSFKNEYQEWYSESKALVRQLLPDRLSDFTQYYEKPKGRRDLNQINYTIEDYLQGLNWSGEFDGTAISHFLQQLKIVESIQERFRSSLFDVRQLAQADLFDTELDGAKELARNKFIRAAGVVAGVVLERHLKEVCNTRSVPIRKRRPQIADLNDALKNEGVIDTPQWRSIQFLGDLRNACAHDKTPEPTSEQVDDLLAGVTKVIKTVF